MTEHNRANEASCIKIHIKPMELRERIVEQATMMFVEQGLKSVRMDDIASSMGISKRTLYEVFADKEQLLEECMTHYFDSVKPDMSADMDSDKNFVEKFITIFESRHTGFTETNRIIMDSLRKYYPKVFRTMVELHHRKIFDQAVEHFRQGVAEGYVISYFEPQIMAVLISLPFGLIPAKRTWSELGSDISEADLMSGMMLLCYRGILTEKGRLILDKYLESKKII